MSIFMISTSYKLDNNGIENSIEKIEEFLTSNDVSHNDIIRTTIAAE